MHPSREGKGDRDMSDYAYPNKTRRVAIIEGLLTEKYMLREGREIIPTAKAFQLMTLLRGLGVEELSRADRQEREGIAEFHQGDVGLGAR